MARPRHSSSVFDGAGRLVQQTAADGSGIRQEYDAVGNLVRRIDAAGSPDERVTVYDYDRNNRLLTQVVAPGTGDALATRYQYDAFGNRIEMTVGDRFLSGDDDFNVFDIPYERSQRYGYDRRNQVVLEQAGAEASAYGGEVGHLEFRDTLYDRDAFGNVVQQSSNRKNFHPATGATWESMARELYGTADAAIAELPLALRPEVLHQTGRASFDETVAAYRARGIEADVRLFIDDTAGAYGSADVAVCRSGALTVAELSAAGVPAVLVPFPAAVDDHQTRNAAHVVRAGAAVLLPEQVLTPVSLAAVLRELLEAGRPRLVAMAMAARRGAIVDADERLADACVAAAGGAS